jgi:outer membrane protein assembly factor BamB
MKFLTLSALLLKAITSIINAQDINLKIPTGYSSVSFSDNTIFLTGTDQQNDILVALDMAGNTRWQVAYGRAWDEAFPESRCTPTVEGDRVYISCGYGDLACVDANTGNFIWKSKGSVIAAEGLLYVYDEKSGFVGLVKPSTNKFDLVNNFKISKGSGPYRAYLVIHNGILYIRHGITLMAFDIRNR